jgi:uncharacterized membrane protein YedE/YeeE
MSSAKLIDGAFSPVLSTARFTGFRNIDLRVVGVASIAILGLALLAAEASGWRMTALWLVAVAMGLTLYQGAFGFSAGYRALLREGRGGQVRGQLLLLAALIALFTPALAAGSVFGLPVRGFVFPIGVELIAGAFLFGVGMQIAGGCASGTLYTVGGGSTRMMVVLISIAVGATAAAASYPSWSGGPQLQAISLTESLGVFGALALQGAVIAGLWLAVRRIEQRRGTATPLFGGGSFLRGGWSYGAAALVLAGLAFATLVLSGRPWGLTQAFFVWGSRAVDVVGLDDPFFWSFWEQPTRVEALSRPFWSDVFSVMNVGIILGAMLAAGLAGKFKPTWRIGFGALVSAVLGGLMLGYGAVLATGCNVAAFLSGVASGSLHGWAWIAAALPGTALGVWLRPFFGLDKR